MAAVGLLLAGCGGGDEVDGGRLPDVPGGAARSSEPAAVTEPASTTSGSGGAARCTAAELRVTLGPGDAGAGSVYRPLVFTNTGSRNCELTGFPGVSYVAGDDGHQVGPAAAMSGPRGGEVRMDPGGASAAELQLVQVRNFDEAVCRPTPVRGLRVYPPGETASLFVPMDGTGCAGEPPGPQLTVKTITPG